MPTYGQAMILERPGLITVQHWKGTASFNNGLRVIAPFAYDLSPTSVVYPGNTYSAGPYAAGTEIILQLYNIPDGDDFVNSNSVWAQFQDGYDPGHTWMINWEDGYPIFLEFPSFPPDNDYNDSYTLITAAGTGGINLSRIKYRVNDDVNSGMVTRTPNNDDWANAIILHGNIGNKTGTNLNATMEENEWDNGDSMEHTVWYKFPGFSDDGLLTIQISSSPSGSGLWQIAGSLLDDAFPENPSPSGILYSDFFSAYDITQEELEVPGGETLYLRIANGNYFGGHPGRFEINWLFRIPVPPVNDDFEDAVLMTPAAAGTYVGTNFDATFQDDNEMWQGFEEHNVYHKFVAPANGTLSTWVTTNADIIDYEDNGSLSWPYVALWTGASVSTIVLQDEAFDGGDANISDTLVYPVTSGNTYYIVVSDEDEFQGEYTLHWTFA